MQKTESVYSYSINVAAYPTGTVIRMLNDL